MGMERPTLRQLEILAEVARIGTFRGAARHLELSQVAVSDHIRQLESRLGCALFIRAAGGPARLSPAGQVVLDHGRNVLFACDSLIAAARSVAGVDGDAVAAVPPVPLIDSAPPSPSARKRTRATPADTPAAELPVAPQQVPDAISLEVSPTPGRVDDKETTIVGREEEVTALPVIAPAPAPRPAAREIPINVLAHPSIVARFQEKLAAAQEAFPDRPIAVDFRAFTELAVDTAFRQGRADIALFYAAGPTSLFDSDYLWSESWSLFVRADHPLAQKELVSVADCADMPLILFASDNPLRAICDACLTIARLFPAPTVLESDDYAAIAEELSYGEAMFPAFGVTAAQFGARPGLRRIALSEPLLPVEVRRAMNPEAEEDPTVAALAGLLA